MMILVLAGGFGSRLQGVLGQTPKALAQIDKFPFLHYQIEIWINQGINSFVFLLHHEANMIVEFLESEKNKKNGLLKDCEVRWLVEPKPMDTGGAVAYAIQKLTLSGDFLLTNADTWLGTGVREVVRSAAPSIAIVRLSDASRYGLVQFNSQLNVTMFIEKSSDQVSGWINTGLCHLNTDFFKDWDGQPFSLERVSFPKLVGIGALKAVPLQTDFIDIGIPDDYFRFCNWISTGAKEKLCI